MQFDILQLLHEVAINFRFFLTYFLQGRASHLTHASVGPNEPHAASPALSDALLEKSDLNFLDQEAEKAELGRLLNDPLPSHPKLHRGQLKNGLCYIILPNKNPANRYYMYR